MVTYLLAISNNSKYVPAIPTPLIYTRRKSPFSSLANPLCIKHPERGKVIIPRAQVLSYKERTRHLCKVTSTFFIGAFERYK